MRSIGAEGSVPAASTVTTPPMEAVAEPSIPWAGSALNEAWWR